MKLDSFGASVSDKLVGWAFFTPVFLFFLALVYLNWVGFISSDDAVYVKGAYGLLNEFPFLGEHGTFRFIITVPVAIFMSIFGENEIAIALISIIYSLAFIALLTRFVDKAAGRRAVLIIAPMLITSPILVINASIASIDVIEAFFVFASLIYFIQASKSLENTGKTLVLSGAMAGLAFLTRETTVFLLVFYGILFLLGIGIKRIQYFTMAFGFFFVWGLEALYFWVFSGDPFYRISRSFGHDSTIDRTIDLAGNLIIHPVIDPLLVLLFNQEFGLLFWALAGLVLWWFLRGKKQEEIALEAGKDKHVYACKLVAGLGLVWFLCAGGVGNLLPLNPRYFLVTNIAAIIVTGLFINDMAARSGATARVSFTIVFCILVGNLVGLWAENKNFLFAEKQLAGLAALEKQTIYTDGETFHRARYLLKWNDALEKVEQRDADNVCGLYFQNRKYAKYAPVGAKVISEYYPDDSFLKVHLKQIGVFHLLPKPLTFRLNGGHEGAVLYLINTPDGEC